MNRCCWPDERAATEHIVKFTAIAFAHGVRKIFFHAGTCGVINGPDAGGVLFEYGGAPRKMYPGVAALTRLLGVPDRLQRQIHENGFHACVFRRGNGSVAVAWCEPGRTKRIKTGPSLSASDVMGNPLDKTEVVIDQSPVYLTGESAQALDE